MVFVGGGAMFLRLYLEKSDRVKEAIFIEDILVNAQGYAKLYNLSKSGRQTSMKGKKNEFVFTIGFKRSNPEHVCGANMLNEMESKNQFIVDAILCYVDSGYMNVRPWNLHLAFIQPGNAPAPVQDNETYSRPDEEQSIDDNDVNEIMQTLQSFRS